MERNVTLDVSVLGNISTTYVNRIFAIFSTSQPASQMETYHLHAVTAFPALWKSHALDLFRILSAWNFYRLDLVFMRSYTVYMFFLSISNAALIFAAISFLLSTRNSSYDIFSQLWGRAFSSNKKQNHKTFCLKEHNLLSICGWSMLNIEGAE